MGWATGYDTSWQRDIGYGVPSVCDHPGCTEEINRGLGYVCGGEPYGGDDGCGLFFCGKHRDASPKGLCERCAAELEPFTPTPDTEDWIRWKLFEDSWRQWRLENPEEVKKMKERLGNDMMQASLDFLKTSLLTDWQGNPAPIISVRAAEAGLDHLEIVTQSEAEKETGMKTVRRITIVEAAVDAA